MSFRYIFTRYHFMKKVGKHLSKNDYDKVIFENHFTEYISLKTGNNHEKYNKKIYYHSHNLPTYYDKLLKEIDCTKVIFSVSKYMDQQNKNAFSSLKNIEYKILRNGVDHNKFKKIYDHNELDKLKEKFSLPRNKTIILFAGRMNRDKGIFEVLNAFENLKDKCHLLLVGDYYFNSKIKNQDLIEMDKMLKKYDGCYSFTGFIDYNLMYQVYNVADIILLPSIWEDPAPLTVIEALSCGKALITTNSGGIPEYARDGSAIIINKDDNLKDGIVSSVLKIINDDNLKKELEEKALEVSRELSLERYYTDFVNIISE